MKSDQSSSKTRPFIDTPKVKNLLEVRGWLRESDKTPEKVRELSDHMAKTMATRCTPSLTAALVRGVTDKNFIALNAITDGVVNSEMPGAEIMRALLSKYVQDTFEEKVTPLVRIAMNDAFNAVLEDWQAMCEDYFAHPDAEDDPSSYVKRRRRRTSTD